MPCERGWSTGFRAQKRGGHGLLNLHCTGVTILNIGVDGGHLTRRKRTKAWWKYYYIFSAGLVDEKLSYN